MEKEKISFEEYVNKFYIKIHNFPFTDNKYFNIKVMNTIELK